MPRPKQQNCQILGFGLRMADFILSGVMSLSAASEWPLYQDRPVLSKPMAVLSVVPRLANQIALRERSLASRASLLRIAPRSVPSAP